MSSFSDKAKPWLDYFEITKDKDTKMWLLSNEPSLFISSTRDFNPENPKISIVDQFAGRQPWLLNYNSCNSAKAGKIFNV